MNIKYLESNHIQVFPVTNKPSEPQSRLTTEYNITNLINRLIDTKSFVITSNEDYKGTDNKALEFTLDGYYIKVEDKTELLTTILPEDFEDVGKDKNPKLFAAANIDIMSASDVEGSIEFIELVGNDLSERNPNPSSPQEYWTYKDYTGIKFIYTDNDNKYPDLFTANSGIITGFDDGYNDGTGESLPGSNKLVYLCILEYVNDNWRIPRESKIRFNQWALNYIDDGDLDNPNTFRPEVNTGVEVFEVTNSGILDLSTVNGVEVVTPEENSSKPVAVLNTDITLKAGSNVTFEMVPNTIDLAGHTFAIEGGEDSKVANFEANEDTEGKVVLKNITVLGVEQ